MLISINFAFEQPFEASLDEPCRACGLYDSLPFNFQPMDYRISLRRKTLPAHAQHFNHKKIQLIRRNFERIQGGKDTEIPL